MGLGTKVRSLARPWMLLVLVGALLVAGVGIADWFQHSEVPHQLGVDEAAAATTAQSLLRSMPQGTCQPASSADLGSLAPIGPWDRVCVYGGRGDRSISFVRPLGSDGWSLFYGPGATQSEVCTYAIADGWTAYRSADPSRPDAPCPRGATYEPGG